jgi:hypothetical protein
MAEVGGGEVIQRLIEEREPLDTVWLGQAIARVMVRVNGVGGHIGDFHDYVSAEDGWQVNWDRVARAVIAEYTSLVGVRHG